ncbi:integrator complex subunit 15 [Stomoxys calcitrans]|uniref:integrator complex subunit 15 n=1 Tax=Stomoxys calcitrans TaxID=35570 RepID=UPI0027E24B6C|nr:integrator complex subunit 15 [Stomoxys calcitrans]
MSQSDIKHALRKLEFPACVKEALPRIENIIIGRGKQNFIMQLISEFVFLEKTKEVDVRRGQSPQSYSNMQMNKIQEFQLILVLIEFFSQPGPDSTRNAVFLSLFGSNLTPQRTKILCKLISTSVSGSVAPLLSSAGTWMQQVGCTTPPSLEVAQSLVSDFIIFSRKTSEQLKQLPLVAPHFAANLMTAVADLYLNEQRGTLTPPPDALLDVVCEWVTENPSLCLASQQPLALPIGAIAMPVVTPLAGLIRWSVLAPILSNRSTYSNLHLSLLQTLLEIVNNGPPTALNAQHLALTLTPLKNYASRLKGEKLDPSQDANFQKCVERLAQAVQVGLSSNCVYGNIPQLLCALETLPPHPLMKIVIAANKTL